MRISRLCVSSGVLLGLACLALAGCPSSQAPSYTPALVVTPQALDFGSAKSTLTFKVSSTWTSRPLPQFTVTTDKSWVTVNPTTGNSTGPSDPVVITATLNRGLLQTGANSATIFVTAPGIVGKSVQVAASSSLAVDFSVSSTIPFEKDPVIFTDNSSATQESGPITGWLWTFGDRTTSTQQHPVHAYAEPGTYSVGLTIQTAAQSLSLTRSNYITVQEKDPPTADFQASTVTPTAFYSQVAFTDLSLPGSSNITQWLWDFGDGSTSSLQNPTHTYTVRSVQTVFRDVTLTVTSAHGADQEIKLGYIAIQPAPPRAAFSVENPAPVVATPVQFFDLSEAGSADITSWVWDFGDGTGTSGQQNPSHTYTTIGTYNVSLTVATPLGSDILTKNAYITVQGEGPTADFTADNRTPAVNTRVLFTDLSLPGQAPAVSTWEWDFGDGTGSAVRHPSHTYTAVGLYTVSLRVTTVFGEDTKVEVDYINVQAASAQDPVAQFQASKTSVASGEQLQFTDLSQPGSTPIGVWLWDFGDGNTSTLKDPAHIYQGVTAYAQYTVSLTVGSQDGRSDTETKPNYIAVSPGAPVVAFRADKTRVMKAGSPVSPMDLIQFTDLSSGGAKAVTGWLWNFGDGATSTLQHPTHSYANAGTYNVTLTITTSGTPPSSSVTKNGYISVFEPGPLDAYVRYDDGQFSATLKRTVTGLNYIARDYLLVSQEWRLGDWTSAMDPTLSDGRWRHWLTIVTPNTMAVTDTALLMVSGGNNASTAPGSESPPSLDPEIGLLVQATGAAVGVLKQIPNQRIFITGDPHNLERSEDQIIAFTFDYYLDEFGSNPETWPALLPMVKGAVKAIDAMQLAIPSLKKFVVTGASKRGWTTWLTGATDGRVAGIMPMVINVLRLDQQMRHHFQAYGEYSLAICDYDAPQPLYPYGCDVISRLGTVRGDSLLGIVDPYAYRIRYTMPKLEICATGDEFFLPDAAQYYWYDLPPNRRLKYVPNVGHSLGGYEEAISAAAPFFMAIATGNDSVPAFTWNLVQELPSGWRLSCYTNPAQPPSEVKVWTATTSAGYRDFRDELNASGTMPVWTSTTLASSGNGKYSYLIPVPPANRWTGAYIEAEFPTGSAVPYLDTYSFTTEVFVVPETMPYSAKMN